MLKPVTHSVYPGIEATLSVAADLTTGGRHSTSGGGGRRGTVEIGIVFPVHVVSSTTARKLQS